MNFPFIEEDFDFHFKDKGDTVDFAAFYVLPDGRTMSLSETHRMGPGRAYDWLDKETMRSVIYRKFMTSFTLEIGERSKALTAHETMLWMRYYADKGLLEET